MRLKLDENLGTRGAAVLTSAGHDVATVWDQGLATAPDSQVIDVCRAEDRCLVTLDLDFANPLQFEPSDYSGIVVLRLPKRPDAEDLMDAIHTLIGGLSSDAVHGKLWVVQRGSIRIYQPEV